MDDLSLAVIIGQGVIILLVIMVARALLGDRNEQLHYYRNQVSALRAYNDSLRNEIEELTITHLEKAEHLSRLRAELDDEWSRLRRELEAISTPLDESNVSKVLDYYR